MLCLALALAGCASLSQAEQADRSKPMNIEADAMRYDDLKQTSVFTGNVVVNKGTIRRWCQSAPNLGRPGLVQAGKRHRSPPGASRAIGYFAQFPVRVHACVQSPERSCRL